MTAVGSNSSAENNNNDVGNANITALSDSQLLAAIDIGSNSFHLILARNVLGALQPLQRRKEQVQLAAGLDEALNLSDKAMRRGLECLEQMGQLLRDNMPDQVRIVATHTVRAAKNRDRFLALAEQAVGFPIEVISGREEARLIFQGVAHTETLTGNTLVIDIGGGSTELAMGDSFDPCFRDSRSMGCVSYSHRYFNKIVNKKTFGKAYTAAMQELESSVQALRKSRWERVLATSGTAKVLAKTVAVFSGDVRAEASIHRDDLVALRDWILAIEYLDELVELGVSESRIHLIPSGLAILLAVMDSLKINSLSYCDVALREGILYEMDEDMRHDDIRRRTRESLQARYLVDIPYAHQVAETCDYLYSQVADSWDLKSGVLGELLHEAAQLHELGLQITASNIQRHSAYILQHSDLPGYNQEQQVILSVLVENYRKRVRIENLPSLRKVSVKKLIRLIRLLRLSVLLNSLRLPFSFQQLQLSTSGTELTLTIVEGDLADNALIRADLEREAEYMSRIECQLLLVFPAG